MGDPLLYMSGESQSSSKQNIQQQTGLSDGVDNLGSPVGLSIVVINLYFRYHPITPMPEANSFAVLDLGIDCSAEKVVETAKAEGIKIVALSGLLTPALDSMKTTLEAIKAAGLKCKVIIGGTPVSVEACASISADECAHSPQKTVATCNVWANQITQQTSMPIGRDVSILPSPILQTLFMKDNYTCH